MIVVVLVSESAGVRKVRSWNCGIWVVVVVEESVCWFCGSGL